MENVKILTKNMEIIFGSPSENSTGIKRVTDNLKMC